MLNLPKTRLRRRYKRPLLRRKSPHFWEWLGERPPQYPEWQPIVPPRLLAQLCAMMRPWANLGRVAGRDAAPAACMLANNNPGCRVALTDSDAAGVAAACASGNVFPSGSSVADSGLPPGVADFIVGVDIGSFAERDGFLPEARRLASTSGLVAVIEHGAMEMSALALAAVDGFWRELIDANGLKLERPDLGWLATLPEAFHDGGLPECAIEVAWTIDRLTKYVLSRAGAEEAYALLGCQLEERLQQRLIARCPGQTIFRIRWPLVVRVAHLK
jgi:hypothetical protein